MTEGEHVNRLIDEYRAFVTSNTDSIFDQSRFISDLSSSEWTISGAYELLRLAHVYGAFMLRNALAISVVLGKEDGVAGF